MHQYKGKLILHTGSMFSGKTSSLWKDVNRFRIAGYKTVVFKPSIDTRYGKDKITTHDQYSIEAVSIESIEDIVNYLKKETVDIIGIDEVQFLKSDPKHVVKVLEDLLNHDYTIVLAGLDMDFETKPFEIVKEIMPKTDYLYKHHAVCASCGVDAWVSFRLSYSDSRIEIGADEKYIPLCRKCYNIKMNEKAALKNQVKLFDKDINI